MTRQEFIQLLQTNNIDEKLVSFDNDLADGYCVRKIQTHWEVFVKEKDSSF